MSTSHPSQGFHSLHNLLDVISGSLAALQGSFNTASFSFPALERPFESGGAEAHLATDDNARRAVLRIVSACEQMVAMVRTPMETLCDAAMGYNLPACLSILEGAHVVEILKAAGPQGMHVRDIAAEAPCEIDPMILSRVLRLLATLHLLTEVSPNRFANNRISSFMDTEKDIDAIRRDPHLKYDSTNGVSAFVAMCTQEMFKSSAYLSESLGLFQAQPINSPETPPVTTQSALPALPQTSINRMAHPIWQHVSNPQPVVRVDSKAYHWQPHAHARTAPPIHTDLSIHIPAQRQSSLLSPRPSQLQDRSSSTDRTTHPRTAFNLAHNTDASYFAWLEAPAQAALLRRFGAAMRGTAEWEMGGVVHGFAWGALRPGALVVDVGGGVGSACMALRAAHPHLTFEIQDRAAVVRLARQTWAARVPAALDSGAVRIEEHDFFAPQRPRADPPAVFLLRAICHDWPDARVVHILARLRAAAGPQTALVLGDHVIPFACADDRRYGEVPGAVAQLAEGGGGLLANLGRAHANAYWLDISMQAMFNGQERTLAHTVMLTRAAGWTVARVNRVGCSLFAYVVCTPGPVEGQEAGGRELEARVATSLETKHRL